LTTVTNETSVTIAQAFGFPIHPFSVSHSLVAVRSTPGGRAQRPL
jgi:hypothetical protein